MPYRLGSGTAGHHFVGLCILQRLYLRTVPDHVHCDFGRRRAQPGKLHRIELCLLVGVERLQRDCILEQADDGAALGARLYM